MEREGLYRDMRPIQVPVAGAWLLNNLRCFGTIYETLTTKVSMKTVTTSESLRRDRYWAL